MTPFTSPAGVPSRLLPAARTSRSVSRPILRPRGRGLVLRPLRRLVHAEDVPRGHIAQERYWSAVSAFNTEASLRTCRGCGEVHPLADLGDVAWPEVAAARRAEAEAEHA